MNGAVAVALAAGMAATVNPCGFALLPAYLSAFVGSTPERARTNAVARALTVSAALTAGFVVVFGIFGLIVSPLALRLEQHLPWVTVVIGVGLVGLGIALLAGRQLTLAIPKLQRGGKDGTLPSMFLFGVSYAIASVSCTIGPFLAVTTATFRSQNWLAGLAVFVTYGLGMGIVIAMLTVAVALAQAGIVQRFRSLVPKMNRIAGALIVLAGAYVAYYGWYEIRIFNGDTDDPIVDRAIELQGWLQRAIVPDRPRTFAIGGCAVLAAVATASRSRSRRTRRATADQPARILQPAAPDGVETPVTAP